MAFTDLLNVTVDDPTKASDYNDLADNTEFNRSNADVEHNFDISTGDGTHQDVTATKLTMSGDIELEDQQLFLDAGKAVEWVSPAALQGAMEFNGLNTMHVSGGTGSDTVVTLQAPAARSAYHKYSDTTSDRMIAGYNDNNTRWQIQEGTSWGSNKLFAVDLNGRALLVADGVTDTVPGLTIEGDNGGAVARGLELTNTATAAANSGNRIAFNAKVTTHGETMAGYINTLFADIGASTYEGQMRIGLARNGAAAADKVIIRAGGDSPKSIMGILQPDANVYGLVIQNTTWSAATNHSDGMIFFVSDAGSSNLVAYKTSTAAAYQNLNIDAAITVISGKETGTVALRVANNQTDADIALKATGTTLDTSVRVRANGDDLSLIAHNAVRLTCNSNTVRIANLPTSASGLGTGDLWNNSGVINVA